ncbi:MAG: hypothetical protein ACK559_20935, partial [bacterium]
VTTGSFQPRGRRHHPRARLMAGVRRAGRPGDSAPAPPHVANQGDQTLPRCRLGHAFWWIAGLEGRLPQLARLVLE